MYRMHLPMVVVFNKSDVQDYGLIETWMRDYQVSIFFCFLLQVFQDAVSDTNSDSFMIPLTRSMGLVLEEFYNTMRTVGVSSVTGEGIGDLLDAIQEAKEEYFTVFLESIKKKREAKAKEEAKKQKLVMEEVTKDVEPEDRIREGAGEIESEAGVTGEDEKERKEFENLIEWADQLKKEHEQMN